MMDRDLSSDQNGPEEALAQLKQAQERRKRLPKLRSLIFWSFQLLFWPAIALAVIGLSWSMQPNMPTPWLQIAVRVASGFIVSSSLYILFQIPKVAALPRRVRWPMMVVVAIISLTCSMLLVQRALLVESFSTEEHPISPLLPRLVTTVLWCSFVFALELIGDLYNKEIQLAESKSMALDLQLRIAEAQASARSAEMRQLQEQLNPHFLFNALNAVVASKNDPSTVEKVTRDLADFLRFTLGEARTFEPLSRELNALEKYLAIQQTRFGENLICRIICDRGAHSVLVPPMLVHPLLENALHYGAQTSKLPLRVDVTAKVEDGRLRVVVANTGHWVPPNPFRSPSTGIRSLRKRLSLLYTENATIDLVTEPDSEGGWVRAVIQLPLQQDKLQEPILKTV
jgi:Histidine kinase